jgi:hypothetical protein
MSNRQPSLHHSFYVGHVVLMLDLALLCELSHFDNTPGHDPGRTGAHLRDLLGGLGRPRLDIGKREHERVCDKQLVLAWSARDDVLDTRARGAHVEVNLCTASATQAPHSAWGGRAYTHVANELDVLELWALHAGAHAACEGHAAGESTVTALDDLAVGDRGHEALRVLGFEEKCLPDLRMAEDGRGTGRVDRGGERGGEGEGHRGLIG